MKELDLLKKDWKKQNTYFPKLSYHDIYILIHKKSSSIVKWIFIICIAEFLFWTGLNFIIPESYLDIYKQFHLNTFLYISQVLHYILLLFFIFIFYKNFKAISVVDSTNLLMEKIINTRKTVNYYVYFNIALYTILSIILNVIMLSNPDILIKVMSLEDTTISTDNFLTVLLLVQITTFAVVCGLLWFYYRIIYGILLKKLNKNYFELKNMEG